MNQIKRNPFQFGLVSSLLTLTPIISALIMTSSSDSYQTSEPVESVLWGIAFISFLICPFVGIAFGIVSLIKKTEPLLLPLIGLMANSLWAIFAIWMIVMASMAIHR